LWARAQEVSAGEGPRGRTPLPGRGARARAGGRLPSDPPSARAAFALMNGAANG